MRAVPAFRAGLLSFFSGVSALLWPFGSFPCREASWLSSAGSKEKELCLLPPVPCSESRDQTTLPKTKNHPTKASGDQCHPSASVGRHFSAVECPDQKEQKLKKFLSCPEKGACAECLPFGHICVRLTPAGRSKLRLPPARASAPGPCPRV